MKRLRLAVLLFFVVVLVVFLYPYGGDYGGRYRAKPRAARPRETLDAYAEAVLADNPVGYWRLGEPTGTNLDDLSGHGHPATIHDPADFELGQPTLLGPGPPWNCGLCGDTNGDGAVTIVDAMYINQYVTGLRVDLPCPVQADVAPPQPQAITVTDAMYISQYTVGLRDTLTCLPLEGMPPE